MYYYAIFGLNVTSDFFLPGARETDRTDNPDVFIHQVDYSRFGPEYDKFVPDEKYGSLSHYEKNLSEYYIPDLGTYTVKNGCEITYCHKSGYDVSYAAQYIMCVCMSSILIQRNILAIHGSCIYYKNKGLIISGTSGSGKSTFASRLLDTGGLFLSDDIVATKSSDTSVIGIPSFPQRNLCADVVETNGIDKKQLRYIYSKDSDKYMQAVEPDIYHDSPVPIDAMVILSIDDSADIPVIKEINGSLKLKYVMDNLYNRSGFENSGNINLIVSKAIDFANKVPIYSISRPSEGMTLDYRIQLMEDYIINK